MKLDALRLVRSWGDDSGRVVGGDPRVALTRDPSEVLVLTDYGAQRLSATSGARLASAAWSPRPLRAPGAPYALDVEGARVLFGTHRGELLLHRTRDGALERSLGRGRAIVDVALSDDGALAVDACDDGRVRVWATAGGAALHTLRGAGPVSVSHEGAHVPWWRGGVRVLDVATGDERRIDAPPSHRRARWSHDGAFLWLFDEARGVTCWHLASGARVALFDRAPAADVAACDRDGSLVRFDRRGAVHRLTVDGDAHTLEATLDESVHTAALAPDAARAAWLRHGSTLCVRDLATGDELHHHGEHAGSITALALSDDGALAATAATDRRVRVWSVATGDTAWCFECPDGAVLDAVFAPDARRLYAACADGVVRAWSLADGQELDAIACPGVSALRASADGARLVATHRDTRGLSLIDLTRASVRRLDSDGAYEHRAASFVGGSDEVVALLSLDRSFVARFDARNGAAKGERAVVGVPRYKPAAFSRDGAALASETRTRGQVCVWDVRSLVARCTLDRADRAPDVLPMALGATRVVVPTRDRVEVWRLGDGACLGELDLRTWGEHPVAVALSADERTLLVATSLARVHHLALDADERPTQP